MRQTDIKWKGTKWPGRPAGFRTRSETQSARRHTTGRNRHPHY
ncbi:hypothetical protein HMPREF9141_2355 [Prevotella multiformis DSM 16608]|uniref:Uncharacterized protein n=1 Tax=Prevotella multiformis DSM 16608 TaxID=888743 RepID=F0F9T8_9BACT|nr:hypothetical protein HMPREF9141_2355 [Prevotella multiformis DSM 16608]